MNFSSSPSPAAASHRGLLNAPSAAARSRVATGACSLALASLLLAPGTSRAVDGCVVMLCFAAPSWRAVPACVPPIRQVLRDLSRGKGLPGCTMAGSANSARHEWASAPGNCPPQYTRAHESENGMVYTCDYAGAVSVTVDGAPFTRTWWNAEGDTVTEFSPAAQAQLGQWDDRFEREQGR